MELENICRFCLVLHAMVQACHEKNEVLDTDNENTDDPVVDDQEDENTDDSVVDDHILLLLDTLQWRGIRHHPLCRTPPGMNNQTLSYSKRKLPCT